jgi:hypothetical protein
MARAGGPSTTDTGCIGKVVDGGPSLAMTRGRLSAAFGALISLRVLSAVLGGFDSQLTGLLCRGGMPLIRQMVSEYHLNMQL